MTRKRVFVSVLFFVVAYAILSWFSYGSYFCTSERTGHNHALTTARLALAFTAWNFLSGWCGALVLTLGKKRSFKGEMAIALFFSTVIAAVGYGSVPFWIYRGPGTFLFENTWADVSCFFTEGYAIVFPFVVAPALALTTLICEWLVIRNASQ
jgi:hypothetical protein